MFYGSESRDSADVRQCFCRYAPPSVAEQEGQLIETEAFVAPKSPFAELKDQITHPPQPDHSVAKQKFRITNWSTYNKALINRGSLTFWLDDEAIQAWYESAAPALF
jgi:hypothetical protein